MRELRTEENEKFEHFFTFVRNAAAAQGAVFFVDCGEGRELLTDTLDGEDLSGWLIPQRDADRFQTEFDAGDVSGQWDDFMRIAVWSLLSKDEIQIKFNSF